MADKPIIGRVTANSTGRTLEGGRVNVAGAWRTVAESYECVGGVWRPSWEKLFTWKKYNTVATEKDGWAWSSGKVNFSFPRTSTVTAVDNRSSANVKYYPTYSNGALTALNITASGNYHKTGLLVQDMPGSYDFFKFENPNDEVNGKYPNANYYYKHFSFSESMNYCTFSCYPPIYSPTTSYSQGSYIEDVTSETADAYPTNGRHTDGYWYVFQG